jgi:hypothetical protein
VVSDHQSSFTRNISQATIRSTHDFVAVTSPPQSVVVNASSYGLLYHFELYSLQKQRTRGTYDLQRQYDDRQRGLKI